MTRINYLKAFKRYRDMILEEISTPTYQAILSSFNMSLFGKVPAQVNNPAPGGDGDSEDEMEDYRRKLKQDSELRSDPPDVDTDVSPSPPPLPTIAVSVPPTPAESDVEEERTVVPRPKAKRKKKGDTILENSVSGNPVPEDLARGDLDRPTRGSKDAAQRKAIASEPQPTVRTSRRNRNK